MIFWTAAFTGLNLSTKGAFVPAKITIVITEKSKGNFEYTITGDRVAAMTKNEMEAAKLLVKGINGKVLKINSDDKGQTTC